MLASLTFGEAEGLTAKNAKSAKGFWICFCLGRIFLVVGASVQKVTVRNKLGKMGNLGVRFAVFWYSWTSFVV